MTQPGARIPLLLDVDTGIDDSLALLYACGSPDAELVAVTCVGGNVDARQVAENTRAVLELAGRDDVEVALGRETPARTGPRDHAGDAWAEGDRVRDAAGIAPAALGPPRRGPDHRRGASSPRRDHPRDPRAGHEPGGCGPAPARAAAASSVLGADGRQLPLARGTRHRRPNGTCRSIPTPWGRHAPTAVVAPGAEPRTACRGASRPSPWDWTSRSARSCSPTT